MPDVAAPDRPRAELARRRRDGAAGAGGGPAGVRRADDRSSPRLPSVAPLFEERTAARAGRDPRRSIARAKQAQLRRRGRDAHPAAAELVRQRLAGAAAAASPSAGATARPAAAGCSRAACARPRGRVHQVEYYLDLVRGLGIDAPERPGRDADGPGSSRGPRPATRADALLRPARASRPARRIVGFAPGRRLRPGQAVAAGSRRAGHRARCRRRGVACGHASGRGADRETGRAIESSLPPGARVVEPDRPHDAAASSSGSSRGAPRSCRTTRARCTSPRRSACR